MSVQQDDASATPVEETIIEGSATATTDDGLDVTAESSPQDENEAKPDLLSVVKAAVEAKVETPEATSSSEAAKEGEQTAEAEAPAKEPTAEEDANLPFGKHPRFKAILQQRNELRDTVASYKDGHEQYERITSFMQHNDLSNEHVVELFRVGALMRTDPDKAYEAVADVLVELGRQTGRTLPSDLREDVEDGRITEERAAELSRARARGERLSNLREQDGQREQSRSAAQVAQAAQQAAAGWETRTRASDPDFKAKEALIADRVASLAARDGPPKTADDAVKMLDRAHREISGELKTLRGARPEIKRPLQPSASGSATVAPKTMREAIAAAASG